MFLNDYSANVLPTVSLVPKLGTKNDACRINLRPQLSHTAYRGGWSHFFLITNLHVALDDLTISHGLVGVVDFIQGEGLGEDLPRVDLTIQDGL